MSSKSSLKEILICSLLVLLAACTSHNDDGESAQPDPVKKAAQTGSFKINLDDVTSDKCLNIQKYYEMVRAFPAETRFRRLSTDFKTLSGSSFPRNFLMRQIAGAFRIEDTTLDQIPDFPVMKQNGCDSITFAAEGHGETYPIIAGKRGTVTYKNEWGGQVTVTWVSPTSVSFDVISSIVMNDCDGGSQGKTMTSENLTWGDDSVFTPTVSEKMISSTFLSQVADAKGYPLSNLFAAPVATEIPNEGGNTGDANTTTDVHQPLDNEQPVAGDRQLLVSKLNELMSRPTRDELGQCY